MGRPSKYPYHLWQDGSPHTLKRGVDFECSVNAMRVRIHEYGREHGYEARTVSPDDETLIVVMFRG